jgi:hypothetical protein
VAEAGVIFLHTYTFPCALLAGFLGLKTVGPDQILILGLVTSLILIDPREAMMPFVVSGAQLVERTRGKIGRTVSWGLVALLVGFAVALPMTTYLQYKHGAMTLSDGWTRAVPRYAIDYNTAVRYTLESQGSLDEADRLSGLGKLRHISPLRGPAIAFFVTFSLVLLFTFFRHRFAWWPLHPLLFLVLGTFQSRALAFSFLLGWLIKLGVTKYGGASLYRRLKPLMIGLIAGEMMSGVLTMIIGSIWYFATGEPPRSFSVMP